MWDIDDLKRMIRDVPDFPKKGVIFKDITTLLSNAKAFATSIDLIGDRYIDQKVDLVVGAEARGFVFGAAPAADDADEAASVQANAEGPATHRDFLTSRRAAMKTPKFWVAFVVTFLVVEVAGTAWMAGRASDDTDDRLKSMASAVKKRPDPGGTDG